MMKFCVFACISFGLANVAASEAYDWGENTHACIVENAEWTRADGDGSGSWENAPKTFFVKVSSCESFVEENQLTPGEPYLSADRPPWEGGEFEFSSAQFITNKCVEHGDLMESYSAVETENLAVGALSPVVSIRLSSGGGVENTNMGEIVAMNSMGFVDYGRYAQISGGKEYAWFTLRGRCTEIGRS